MMDFLNSLWIAISNPNEVLIKVLSVPMIIFLEAPISFYIINNLLNLGASKRQKILYIIASSLMCLLSGFIIPSPFNILFIYIG